MDKESLYWEAKIRDWTISEGREDIADLLYQHGVKVSKDDERITLTFEALIGMNSLAGFKFVCDRGYIPFSSTFNYAITMERHDICNYLYRIGCPISGTTLAKCIKKDNSVLLKTLLSDGYVKVDSYLWNMGFENGNEKTIQVLHDNYDTKCHLEYYVECIYCINNICSIIDDLTYKDDNLLVWLSHDQIEELKDRILEDKIDEMDSEGEPFTAPSVGSPYRADEE